MNTTALPTTARQMVEKALVEERVAAEAGAADARGRMLAGRKAHLDAMSERERAAALRRVDACAEARVLQRRLAHAESLLLKLADVLDVASKGHP